jgi:2-dehydropantoate 2-reductase
VVTPASSHDGAVRYVVYGAGAVGGAIGGLLARAGCPVVLVARGRHLEALQSGGLELRRPDPSGTGTSAERIAVAATATLDGLGLGVDDVIVLAVKSQDTAGALDAIVAAGGSGSAVVCAQNGVENERQAARRFGRVYGMVVLMPAAHLEPGVVELTESPVPGVLDLGCYPSGVDATAEGVAADLRTAGFAALAHPAIMGRKYRKLLANLANVLDAAAGPDARRSPLAGAARREALACFAAAGIDVAPEAEDLERRRLLAGASTPMANLASPSSSWQSLARRTGSIEVDYLNGEIVLLGRLHGVATPVNELLCRLGARLVADGLAPGSVPVERIEALARQ